MRRLALAVVLGMLLWGCAPTREVPPPPSGVELDALINVELNYQWQYVGLDPSQPRPTVERVRIVTPDEAEAVHGECVIAAGYEDFRTAPGAVFGGASRAQRLAIYTCVAQYPLAPSAFGLYSRAQLEYLYEHYQLAVIPCLLAAGVEVRDIPPREEFINPQPGSLFPWTPFSPLDHSRQLDYLAFEKCRYLPEGF